VLLLASEFPSIQMILIDCPLKVVLQAGGDYINEANKCIVPN
jgi:hypothetical protein